MGVDCCVDVSSEDIPSMPKNQFARERRNSCTTSSARPERVQVPEKNWVSEPKFSDELPEEPGLGHLKPKSHNFSDTNVSMFSVQTGMTGNTFRTNQTAQTNQTARTNFSGNSVNEDFFEMLHRHMANRYDDQRAPLPVVKEEVRSPPTTSPQSSYPPVSQLRHQNTLRNHQNTPVRPKPKRATQPLRTFSNMPPISQNLLKTNARVAPESEIWTRTNKLHAAPSQVSVTESEESFFQLISRMQGNRLDDQRCSIPMRGL